MKNYNFIPVILALLFLSSCQREISLSESLATEPITEMVETVLESWTEYPPNWTAQNQAIDDSRHVILEALPGSVYKTYNIAYYMAQSLAEDFNWIGVQKFKEIEIIEDHEDYFVVRFIAANDDVYATSINKWGGTGDIWKEGKEEPVYRKWERLSSLTDPSGTSNS